MALAVPYPYPLPGGGTGLAQMLILIRLPGSDKATFRTQRADAIR